MHSPDLSIIVPTRNRYVTALACAKQVLTCEGDFELIVRDCSDSDKLREALENLQDQRIRYDYQPPPVSMTDNWEAAISLAQGDYICIIGDDDGINPIAPKIAGYMKALHIQALMHSVPSGTPIANYEWPGFRGNEKGQLMLKHCLGTIKKEIMTLPRIKQMVRTGGIGYKQLPMLYNHLIARNVVQNHQKLTSTGRVFDSLSPDVYTAYAFMSTLKEYYVIDYPLTISGGSSSSNSSRHGNPNWDGKEHIEEYDEYQLPILVPPIITFKVTLAESMITALENTQRQDLIKFVPLEKLYALTIGHRPSHWKRILRHLHNKVLVDKSIIYKFKFYVVLTFHLVERAIVSRIIRSLLSKFLSKQHEKSVLYEAQDINEAAVILTQYLNEIGVTEKVIERLDLLVKNNREKNS
jgi:glycosyltransferase involved in cell wall biosynthesis